MMQQLTFLAKGYKAAAMIKSNYYVTKKSQQNNVFIFWNQDVRFCQIYLAALFEMISREASQLNKQRSMTSFEDCEW